MPADVDDRAYASGGNTYDRRIAQAAGLPLVRVDGSEDLARALAELPDGASAVLDGLVACPAPEVVVPQATRLRLVVLLHLQLADETGLAPEVAADLDRREHEALHAVDAVVATSAWARRRAIEHHGLAPDKVRVVEPGVDPAPLAPAGPGNRLLCVGSLTPRKGQDLLAAALTELAELDWSCTCVGSLHRDPGFVARLRVPAGMTIAGALSDAELNARYDTADLLVLPSRGETYGMVITEALARGIPVLATAVDALPDTVGASGLLVAPDDVAALRDALRAWLTDPELRARLRAAARSRRDRLSGWDEPSRLLRAVLTGEPTWSR
ncbi:glycosyltransferase family 4 protein [Labedaea rhizosphaerae]|uniref:glycosyltransferase family 4 protein n=1 Tax=Labedaea rhizosphaerae TaxID=598644 RepID=UPI0031330BB4